MADHVVPPKCLEGINQFLVTTVMLSVFSATITMSFLLARGTFMRAVLGRENSNIDAAPCEEATGDLE